MATQPIGLMSYAELTVLVCDENTDLNQRFLALWRMILLEAAGSDAASTVRDSIRALFVNGIGGINA